MDEYSDLTKRKIQLYFASNFLYARGKSHPQVVEILSEVEEDHDLLVAIADAAMVDKWRKIFNKTQQMVAEGRTYKEIIDEVAPMEDDPEILHFICNIWYDVQTAYLEHLIDSPTNIWEGMQWTIICALGLAFMIFINASLFTKIIWGTGVIVSAITWWYGLKQKKLARALRKILDEDYTKFGKII